MSISRRLRMFLAAAFLVLPLCSSASAQYVRTDLVTDSGTGGTVADGNLVNAWGLTALPGSPFWVSDNATGLSTLYAIGNSAQGVSASRQGLVITIPAARGGQGSPTGIVGNTTGGFTFTVNGNTHSFLFIFSTFDGTISAWHPAIDPISNTGASTASLKADRSGVGAVYTGLAIGTNAGHPLLFAADDGPNRRIDVFDTDFNLVDLNSNLVGLGPDAFDDPKIPRNFTPYGIQTIPNGDGSETVWVTYTALNKAQGGFIDAFTTAGVLIHHFAVQGPLHSPWGIAKAPDDFGPMSNALLVSNNISRGRINAFDPNTGAFLGPLRDESNNPIEIDGVWAIQFGQGGGPNGLRNELFFTAGPKNYANGTFGVITVAP
jgi:uncharacterized protein (TIGR03118 family)